MANIWDTVDFDPCQRPAYTNYELSKLVQKKRSETGLTVEEFANKYGISSKIIVSIEKVTRSFNHSMYSACSKVLELSLQDILRQESETLDCVSYRASSTNKVVLDTVNIANQLFNEMVMQKKIAVR